MKTTMTKTAPDTWELRFREESGQETIAAIIERKYDGSSPYYTYKFNGRNGQQRGIVSARKDIERAIIAKAMGPADPQPQIIRQFDEAKLTTIKQALKVTAGVLSVLEDYPRLAETRMVLQAVNVAGLDAALSASQQNS